MERAKIKETDFEFRSLSEREYTDMIVIHHTGVNDIDASAEQIHDWHYNHEPDPWAGIGYHFVIRKDGTIERGRPEWAIGSHAYGENSHTLGIHLSGDFMQGYPTEQQIESCALLIANLCEDYDIPTDRDHIVGHGELMATSCPGTNLQALLDDGTLTGKANFYRYGPPQEEQPEAADEEQDAKEEAWREDLEKIQQKLKQEDVEKIAILARKYESSGDPACVSSGAGDLGGISYGLYQLSSNVGSVNEFLAWLCDYPVPELANYGKVLSALEVNSEAFIQQWKEIGTIDPGNFGMLQDTYIMERYYGEAARLLCRELYCADKHTTAMKAVILSRAVQNGASGCVELFRAACEKMGHPNLSYVDDTYFDDDLIEAIYDFLIEECESATAQGGNYRSTNGFCNGSRDVIAGLKNRFAREKADALGMLTGITVKLW